MQKGFLNQYNMYKSTEKMVCLELDDGVILPRIWDEDSPIWGKGGVCNSQGEFVGLSEYHGGWAEHGGNYSWEEEEYLDEDVLYFGVFFNHWGHFLVDLVGRMWYCARFSNEIQHMKVAYLGEEEPKGNYLQFFELLGVQQKQLIHITKPTRCRKVIVPQFSCRPCIWYTEEYEEIFDSIIEKVDAETPFAANKPDNQKIYFSRLNLAKARASEFGEKWVAKWMEYNGYDIISPEKLSLKEQIYLWNTAEEIVCLNGSIPINIIFSQNRNLELTVLNKTKLVHKNLDLFLLIRPCSIMFLDIYFEPFKNYPKSLGEGPFMYRINEDVYEFSKEKNLEIPFSKWQIRLQFVGNYIKLLLAVLDIKGKFRRDLFELYRRIKK